MTDDFLFVSYDEGEFGGGVYAVPLSAGVPSGPARRITDYSASAFAEGSQGEVWVGGGLSHLGLEHGWLMKWQDGLATFMIDQSNYEDFPPGVNKQAAWRLDRPSEISGIAFGADRQLLLMAARIGVLKLGPKGIVPVVLSDFYVSYSELGYGVGCFPQGIAVGDKGEIFVAMRSLGVLRFRREGNGYRLTQLQFRTDAVTR